MPRGNPYARGGDVMKTRSEKRKEKQAKLAKTNRVIRLKRRLGRIAAKKFAGQEDSHMTALMESYILRRKEERAAERAKEAAGEDAVAAAATSSGGEEEAEASFGEGDNDGEGSSDAFSLGSAGDDSAFEMDGDDDEASEEEVEDIATSRRRAAETKRQRTSPFRGGGRGSGRGNGGRNAKRESADSPKWQGGRGAVHGGRGGSRGRGRGRGGQRYSNQREVSASRYQQRPRKVSTHSLY